MKKDEIIKIFLTLVVLGAIGLYIQSTVGGRAGVNLQINKTMADVPATTGK